MRVKEGIKRGIVSVDYVGSVCGVGTWIQRQFVCLKMCVHGFTGVLCWASLCVYVQDSAHIYFCTCVTEVSDCVQFVSLCLSFHHQKRKCVCGLVCVWWQGAILTEREQDS